MELEEGDEELLAQGVLGVGSNDVGADEDDFMAAKRRKDVVDRVKAEKKAEEKRKKQALKEAKIKAHAVQRDLPQQMHSAAPAPDLEEASTPIVEAAVSPSAPIKPRVSVAPRSKPKVVTF